MTQFRRSSIHFASSLTRSMTLFAFLHELENRKIHFELGRHREDTVMVKVAVPGERWEVEFFEDGAIDVETFRSIGEGLEGEEALERLFREFSD